jgi:hypothetical protein
MIKTNEVITGLFILTTVGLATLVQTLLKIYSGQGLLNLYILGGIIAYVSFQNKFT